MKRFTRILSAAVLAAMLVLAFTACTEDGGTKKPADTKASTKAPEQSTAPSTTEPSTTTPSTTESDGTASSAVTLVGKTYAFDSISAGGVDMSSTITAMYKAWEFTFKDDGVCEQKMVWADALAQTAGAEALTVPGTYEQKGDKVSMHFNMEGEELDMEFTIADDELKVVEEEGTTVFKLKTQG